MGHKSGEIELIDIDTMLDKMSAEPIVEENDLDLPAIKP